MSQFTVKLCWKNIWRNKRRTILTVNAIAFGVTWLIWGHNYYDAFHEQLIDNAIRFQNGHLIIQKEGYQESRPPGLYLRHPMELVRWIAKQPEVKAFAPRIYAGGLLSSAVGSANITFVGIHPGLERNTTSFSQSVTDGDFQFLAQTRKNALVLGKALAKRLDAKVGSKLVALTQGIDGSIGNELFEVTGVFDTQSEMDKSIAFIKLKAARSLLSLPDRTVHEISIVLEKEKNLPAFKKKTLPIIGNRNVVIDWKQAQKHLMGIIELDKAANRILMMIILAIASLGISNAILMSIMDRKREFGILMALGTQKSQLIRLVFGETLLLSLTGILIGNLLGVGLTLYFNHQGFDLAWLTNREIRINGSIIQTVSYPTVHWMNNVVITAAILALSSAASLVPIHYITKLQAVRAIHNGG